jgi:hypothetical protein
MQCSYRHKLHMLPGESCYDTKQAKQLIVYRYCRVNKPAKARRFVITMLYVIKKCALVAHSAV